MKPSSMFLLACLLTLSSLPVLSQNSQAKRKEISDYVLSLAKQNDSDAYFILESDQTGIFVKYFRGSSREEIAKSAGTAVHETCHRLNFLSPKADMFNNESYYITGDIIIECPRTKTIKSNELNAFVPKLLQQKVPRYSLYMGDYPSEVSSIVQGIYGMMDEFSAYYHESRIDYALHKAGIIKIGDSHKTTESSEGNHTTNTSSVTWHRVDLLDSFYEFNLFISWYLQYTKKKYPAIFKGIHDNTNFRIAYTLLYQQFAQLVAQVKADPDLRSYYYTPSSGYFHSADSLELQNFRMKDVDISNYRQHLTELPKKDR